ncbi:MAG TPA: hypothetical protein VGK18_00695 [Propionicimonas sp.]|jgi:hypothetical protein|uniref:hypothetical protein n=1 Tax=Propionicimonas sp. TaxID=1955623 RepID=UPI002F415E1D
MNSSSDDRGRAPAVRMAGIGLSVLGAVGGVAGWFTLAGAADVPASSLVQTGATSVAGSTTVGTASGPAHTRTGGS